MGSTAVPDVVIAATLVAMWLVAVAIIIAWHMGHASGYQDGASSCSPAEPARLNGTERLVVTIPAHCTPSEREEVERAVAAADTVLLLPHGAEAKWIR